MIRGEMLSPLGSALSSSALWQSALIFAARTIQRGGVETRDQTNKKSATSTISSGSASWPSGMLRAWSVGAVGFSRVAWNTIRLPNWRLLRTCENTTPGLMTAGSYNTPRDGPLRIHRSRRGSSIEVSSTALISDHHVATSDRTAADGRELLTCAFRTGRVTN